MTTTYDPYSAPEAHVVEQPQGEAFELADRAMRLGAAILDNLIAVGPMFILLPILIAMMGAATARLDSGAGGPSPLFGPLLLVMGIAGVWALVVLIVNLVLLHRYGQTMAKRLLKIQIVRRDGSRAGLGRIVLLRIIVSSLPGLIPFLGYVWGLVNALFIFRADRRCIHDHIADTIVVKYREATA